MVEIAYAQDTRFCQREIRNQVGLRTRDAASKSDLGGRTAVAGNYDQVTQPMYSPEGVGGYMYHFPGPGFQQKTAIWLSGQVCYLGVDLGVLG